MFLYSLCTWILIFFFSLGRVFQLWNKIHLLRYGLFGWRSHQCIFYRFISSRLDLCVIGFMICLYVIWIGMGYRDSDQWILGIFSFVFDRDRIFYSLLLDLVLKFFFLTLNIWDYLYHNFMFWVFLASFYAICLQFQSILQKIWYLIFLVDH